MKRICHVDIVFEADEEAYEDFVDEIAKVVHDKSRWWVDEVGTVSVAAFMSITQGEDK